MRMGPPRALVVLACNCDKMRVCPQHVHWQPVTECLAKHIKQVSPRCRNVLHLAGIKQKEVPPKNDEENSLSKKHTTQKKEEQNEDKDVESKHDLVEEKEEKRADNKHENNLA